jgi:hypothetical protein
MYWENTSTPVVGWSRRMAGRQLEGDHRGTAARAADLQPAVHGRDPLGEPGQAAAGLDARAAAAVVADPHPQQPGRVHGLQRGTAGAAVLPDVREQFRRAEVGDGLDRRRRAFGHVHDKLYGYVAARGERGAQALVEHGRVDAAGQVAQLGNGLLGAAVGGGDQFQDPLPVTYISRLAVREQEIHRADTRT